MSAIDRRGFSLSLAAGLSAGWSVATAGDEAPANPAWPGGSASKEGTVGGLTDVPGIRVGHFTDGRRPTGCTVVLTESGAVCGVDVRGGAPGTRETDLLHPVNTVDVVHGIVLSGGSAFGLDAATGVVRYLEERGVGFATGVAKVPIVPAAILFDLAVGDPRIRPDAAAGYEAARAASPGSIAEGCVGVGAGATVGKLFGTGSAMKSGLGTASVRLPGGALVAALVAVNALGDVVDPTTGRLLSGARTTDGKALLDTTKALLDGHAPGRPLGGEHTTLGVVATNVALTKAEATKVAQMAHDGLARAVRPVHTPWDGDTLFAVSTGGMELDQPALLVGVLAAEAVAKAIVRAVTMATGLPGLPAASDLARG
jgi:L-aminopeptidase/D-esterase-like protein